MTRRCASALLFLLMLNITALGDGLFSSDGSNCSELMAKGVAASNAMPDMPGMNMDDSPHPASEQQAPVKQGCKLPWAPGCASAAPCAPAALTVSSSATTLARPASAPPVAAACRAPALADDAPDHPPPRI